mgnify:CR=1 FL=1
MKTVYPVIATALVAVLLCGCLRYDPNLITRTETDPSVPAETATKDYYVVNLPFMSPETTVEEFSTEPPTATEDPTEPQTEQPTAQAETAPDPTGPESVVPQAETLYGTAGRLHIPSVGISVPINFVRLAIDDAQQVVDAPDSAAYFWLKDVMPVIADHNNQSFSTLHRVKKGDVAFVANADGGVGKYVCNHVCYGTNTGTDILDDEGFSIAETVTASLIMYTCCDNWHDVLITYWKAI